MRFEQFLLRQPGGGVDYAARVVLRHMKETGYKPAIALWADVRSMDVAHGGQQVYGHFHCIGVKP